MSKEYRSKGNDVIELVPGVCCGKEQGSEQEGKAPNLKDFTFPLVRGQHGMRNKYRK